MENKQEVTSTMLGIAAIALWSTNLAFSRSVIEDFGIFTGGAAAMLIGGSIGLLHLALIRRKFACLLRLPAKYLIGGCLMAVTSITAFNLAIGLATSRQQVIIIGLINYLWPGLTLLLSIPILHKRGRIWLLPGIVISFSGVALATLKQGTLSWHQLAGMLHANWGTYLLAFIGALTWALYLNYSRRWAANAEVSGMALFIFVTGLVMAMLAMLFPEHPQWTAQSLGGLLFLALGPTLLAYGLWDRAMRKGKLVLLASLSYLIPLFSTVISCVYLRVPLEPIFWLACGLVITGAVISNFSVYESTATSHERRRFCSHHRFSLNCFHGAVLGAKAPYSLHGHHHDTE